MKTFLQLQFVLFASIVAIAAAFPGYYAEYENAAADAGHDYGSAAQDYGQIARGDAHGQESHGHHYEEELVDYYVS